MQRLPRLSAAWYRLAPASSALANRPAVGAAGLPTPLVSYNAPSMPRGRIQILLRYGVPFGYSKSIKGLGMTQLAAGDIVHFVDQLDEMLVLGRADDDGMGAEVNPGIAITWFCVWERNNHLFEEVFPEEELILVRKYWGRIAGRSDFFFPAHAISFGEHN